MDRNLEDEARKLASMPTNEAYEYSKSILSELSKLDGNKGAQAKLGLGIAEAVGEFLRDTPGQDRDETVIQMLPYLFDAWIVPILKLSGFSPERSFQTLDGVRSAAIGGALDAVEKFVREHDRETPEGQGKDAGSELEDWSNGG